MSARNLGAWLALAALASFLAACNVTQGAPMPTPPSARPGPAPTATADPLGKLTYDKYCAACHGLDGIAVASDWTPNLASQGLLTVVDDAFLRENTLLGRPGANGRDRKGTKMSPYEGLLSAEQLDAVVAYMRAWQTAPSIALAPYDADGDPEAGRRIYEVTCASCHGLDGWGDLAPRLAGENFQRSYSDALIRHTILHGRPGTRMPPHLLTDAELNDVVSYVRTLGGAPAEAPAATGAAP